VGILLAPAAQRQGWATQALELLAAYAFAFLKLHQLYAHVPVDNEASKRLFLRSGFRVTGTLTDWLTAPQGYTDVLVLQRIGHN
jgi:diamine N-acetyltransferase